jgi:hypothetical protein
VRQEILKDRLGNRIGQIDTDSTGKMIGKDRLGNRVGEYDPKSDVTRDRLGNRVAAGNVLANLVVTAAQKT